MNWIIETERTPEGDATISTANGLETICTVHCHGDKAETENHARLIAAAPAMRDVICDALKVWEYEAGGGPVVVPPWVVAARAALAMVGTDNDPAVTAAASLPKPALLAAAREGQELGEDDGE